MVTQKYSLGFSPEEHQRLQFQGKLYGDTADITFDSTSIVCEIGCGSGANLWIASQVSNGKYIGLDIDAKQIEAASALSKQNGLSNVEFHLTDGHHLALPDQSVNATFVRCVLIHQPDPMVLGNEMYRITASGGRLIVIEPHTPSYYCAPNHKHLLKCWRARADYAYGKGKGSPDIALNLYPLFKKLGLLDIIVRPHIITSFGMETERTKAILKNWLEMVERSADELLKNQYITQEDLAFARHEASEVSSDTFVYQSLWIAEGIKP